jgi:hypothetical protein
LNLSETTTSSKEEPLLPIEATTLTFLRDSTSRTPIRKHRYRWVGYPKIWNGCNSLPYKRNLMNEKQDIMPLSTNVPSNAEERTKLAEERADLSVKRKQLSKERIELSEQRIDLSEQRIELAEERTDLAADRRSVDEAAEGSAHS